MRRVLLIGNGLSVAANAQYALEPLTAAVRARLETVQIGQRTAREHLEAIGQQMEADGEQDADAPTFERLLGPLDRLSGLLGSEVAQLVGAINPELLGALKDVAALVDSLYTRGVGAVLSEIDALAAQANLAPVTNVLLWASAGLQDGDALSVYTLNYDPLIDRVLLDLEHQGPGGWPEPQFDLADEYSGMPVDHHELVLVPGTNAIGVRAPRVEPYKRDRPVDLVHLHGGQHWLRAADGLLYKTERLNDLRDLDAYGRWTRGEPTAASPSVLLTDQKSAAVARSPFREGYVRLRHDLGNADRIAVLGYGFGDLPVNRVLREAFAHPKAGSRWVFNRRSAPDIESAAESYAETAFEMGVEPEQIDTLLSDLPNITTSHPNHFT